MTDRPLIYLASSSDLRDRVERLANHLEDNGFAVPNRWWKEMLHDKGPDEDDDWYEWADVVNIANRHLGTVRHADALVFVCPPADEEPRKFNGANLEAGYAFAHDVPVVSIGAIERSALYAHFTRVEDQVDLIPALRSVIR